ncbi:uncharacterized protein LOC123013562 [Tribolium madens]|uniref:uncharacterized protein LOC123013562 n=1 Tax=Tribolium madens TaxID=41895 RepID=UPI001CF75A68|nr:uncharacterized protein LOC123013562 [Tribolium madens]
MYQLLPFLLAANFGLPEVRVPVKLPVEIWSTIFRFLDPLSLLSVVQADGGWSKICQEDPVLKKRVQEELIAVRKRQREEILNPGLLYTIERTGPTKKYGTNLMKNYRIRAPTVTKTPPGFAWTVGMKRRRPQNDDKRNVKRCCRLLRL